MPQKPPFKARHSQTAGDDSSKDSQGQKIYIEGLQQHRKQLQDLTVGLHEKNGSKRKQKR